MMADAGTTTRLRYHERSANCHPTNRKETPTTDSCPVSFPAVQSRSNGGAGGSSATGVLVWPRSGHCEVGFCDRPVRSVKPYDANVHPYVQLKWRAPGGTSPDHLMVATGPAATSEP